jgi:hypothetical protein
MPSLSSHGPAVSSGALGTRTLAHPTLNALDDPQKSGTMLAVFWPYRPRQGFPVVPRWRMIVLLIVAVAVYVAVVSLISHQPDYGPNP